MEKITNTFVYEGIVSEQQGNKLCIKYKDYEAQRIASPFRTFFTKYLQKGYITLCDEDIKQLIPYSMEGQKVKVTIELIDY